MASRQDQVRSQVPARDDDRSLRPIQAQKPAASYHAEGKSPEQIRRDIEQTRAEMSDTVDVIQERLAPDRLRAQARDAVREATIGRVQQMANEVGHRAREAGYGLQETIRRNPIPAAMVAVGLGWIVVQSTMGGDGHAVRESDTYRDDMYREGVYREGMREDMGERRRRMADEARMRAENVATRAQEMASDTVSQVQERAGELVGQVQERAQEVGSRAQYQMERARGRFEVIMDENPLAVGVVALAAGAVVGMLLPRTRQEDKMMGPARDKVMQQAGNVAEDVLSRAEQAVDEAGKSVEETAQKTMT